MAEAKKICFKDLSGWLKFAVIISFVLGALWVLSFITALILGFAGITQTPPVA